MTIIINMLFYLGGDKILNENCGDKLRKIRKSKNLTQNEVASRLNISRQAYSKYERGESCPSLDKLLLLSFILKENIVEIYLFQEKLFPRDIQIKRFITKSANTNDINSTKTDYNQIYLLVKLFTFLTEEEKLLIITYIVNFIQDKRGGKLS